MNFIEYIPLARRTECSALLPEKDRLLHACMGLSAEAAELLEPKAHIGEELGDICWYLAIGFHAMGLNLSSMHFEASELESSMAGRQEIALLAGDALNQMKRRLFYGALDHQAPLAAAFASLLGAVHSLCEFCGIELEDVLDRNIAKLKIRYPAKFTTESALNRDLAAEAKVL